MKKSDDTVPRKKCLIMRFYPKVQDKAFLLDEHSLCMSFLCYDYLQESINRQVTLIEDNSQGKNKGRTHDKDIPG